MELPTFKNKTLLINKPNDKSKKLNINLIVSSLVITCIVLSLFTIPKQPSKADHIIDRISNSISWTQSVQVNTWITNILTTKPVVRKATPIVMNNIWSWESEKTNQGWVKFVLSNEQQSEVANYLWSKNPDPAMLATFMAESGLFPWSKSNTSDFWLCQLNYTYNKKIIDDPRFFTNWKWQADYCVSKWLVANHNIWVAYSSKAYIKYLYLFND